MPSNSTPLPLRLTILFSSLRLCHISFDPIRLYQCFLSFNIVELPVQLNTFLTNPFTSWFDRIPFTAIRHEVWYVARYQFLKWAMMDLDSVSYLFKLFFLAVFCKCIMCAPQKDRCELSFWFYGFSGFSGFSRWKNIFKCS